MELVGMKLNYLKLKINQKKCSRILGVSLQGMSPSIDKIV
jgi:hypothetical protein